MYAIAAVDQNWGIGKNGKLLTSIPADMAYFRKMTLGKALIMGRRTLESFPGKKPLPGRLANIVITSREDYSADGICVVHSPEEAVRYAERFAPDDVFVIGGGMIYKALLPYCTKAFITKIDYSFDADTSFPDLDADPSWELAETGEEQTYFDLVYEFDVYVRKEA